MIAGGAYRAAGAGGPGAVNSGGNGGNVVCAGRPGAKSGCNIGVTSHPSRLCTSNISTVLSDSSCSISWGKSKV